MMRMAQTGHRAASAAMHALNRSNTC